MRPYRFRYPGAAYAGEARCERCRHIAPGYTLAEIEQRILRHLAEAHDEQPARLTSFSLHLETEL